MNKMKIAYIGYDQSAYLSLQGLTRFSDQVDYFLIHPEINNNFKVFSSLDIFVNHVMIPCDELQRTIEQKRQFDDIKNNYYKLFNWICDSRWTKLNDTKEVPVDVSKPKTTKASEIIDIRVEDRQKKCFIEVKQKGLEEFDLVIVEDHNLISQFFQERNIKYFRRLSNQSRTWTGFEFSYDLIPPKKSSEESVEFFMVNHSEFNSIIDNFYLVNRNADKLMVWQWLPTHQLDNPQFDKFTVERLRELIAKKFKFLTLKEQDALKFKATVNCEANLKKFSDDLFMTIPNFSFWEPIEVVKYLNNRLEKKMKDYLKEVDRKNREAERFKEKANRELNS